MKKRFCLILALVLMLSVLVSCGEGASIAIGALRLDNEVKNLFKFTDAVSYNETVTYLNADGTPAFTAEYYYEVAEDLYAGYNLTETIGDYRLYAYEGAVYAEKGNGLTAVLLLSGTYLNFIESYLNGAFILDGNTQIQRSSTVKDGVTYAVYESTLTPQQIARASSLGVREGDLIISTYGVRENTIESVEYKIERDGKQTPAAKREIRVASEKEDRFAAIKALSEEKVSVDFVFVNGETDGRHFEVPKGVMVGMETGDHDYTFYLDEECTQEYSFADAPVEDALKLYVVEK